MTEQEIMDKCGLKPWSEQAGQCYTTRMLVLTLVVVSEGKSVAIAGRNYAYSLELVRRAREMAQLCCLNEYKIRIADRAFPATHRDHYRGRQ
jgi:hypothetical protein